METGKIRKQVETEFDAPIDKVLIALGKEFRSLNTLADALGVSYQVLTYWIENYLSVDKEDFYKKAVCKSNCLKIRIKNGYRYRLNTRLHCQCKCLVGLNCLVARVEPQELRDLCAEQGWNLETAKDGFLLSF